MTSQQQLNNRNINNGGNQLQTGQKQNSLQTPSDVTLPSGFNQNTELQNGDQPLIGSQRTKQQKLSNVSLDSGFDQRGQQYQHNQQKQAVKTEKSPMSKQTIILLVLGSLTSAVLLGLLIYNIVEMNKAKDKVCSLEKECIKKPPETVLTPSKALETVESIKKDTVEGFLETVDETSQQEADTDADLLSSLIKADIQAQKQQGIENPVINVDRLIEDAKSSFKNSDAIVALIQQKLQKTTDDFVVQEITPTPSIDYPAIIQQKDEQIKSLQEKTNEFVAEKIMTPTPFIDYKTILETRKVEIDNLKSDIQKLKERNEKIDVMLEEKRKEIIQKKTEIQEIKRSNMSKQKKITQIKLKIKEKNKKIDEINELVALKNTKIDEKNKKIDDINQVVTTKENKITSLKKELEETVPTDIFKRFKEVTKENNKETANAMRKMLGLKRLFFMRNYGSSPISDDSIFPENLEKEEGIISTDREKLLVHQSDGNIVSYNLKKDLKNNKNGTYSGTAIWASDTSPRKKKGKNISFEWDKITLKPDKMELKGTKIKEWRNFFERKKASKEKKEKYQTRMSQSFDNNSIDIKYELKHKGKFVRIL